MGIITKTLNWITHPYNDKSTDALDWFAFFVLVVIASFLWTKVVRQVLEATV